MAHDRRRTASRGMSIVALATAASILAAMPAIAAESPSPSPSASASESAPASPSPTPIVAPAPSATVSSNSDQFAEAIAEAANASDTEEATEQPKPTAEELAVGIARIIPYKSTATAVGADGLATATIAIPAGLVPIVVKGTLTSVADNPGVVRIRIGKNYVELDAEVGGDWELAVPPGSVVDRNLTIEVRNTLELPEGVCAYDTTTTETIDDIRVGFIGRETPPTTIAGFFSPPVQKVTIVGPADTIADAEATLAAVGALARRYDQSVTLTVSSPEDFAADPDNLVDTNGPNRIVKLVPNDDASTTIKIDNPGVPRMTISGPASKLPAAAASLESIGLGLAAVPDATELAETENPDTTSVLTLTDLGAPKPTLEGLGRLTYVLALRQDVFGGPVQSAAVHLEGVHTPVPTNASATTSILWNDQLVSSSLMEGGDIYSVDVSVPPSLMRRDNFLTVRVDAVSRTGSCESGQITQSFQLDIDGNASTITGTPGQSLAPGFGRFPQTLGNNLRVAFGSRALTPSMVESAADLVIALQRASTTPMTVSCEDFDTFISASYPGVVVGATPDDANALKAPLRFEPWRTVTLDLTEFTVTVDGEFAALEAFDIDGRDVVLLGGTDPAAESESLQRSLAEEAANGVFGWFGLNGTLLIAQPGAEFLPLQTGELVPQSTTLAESRQLPLWWLIAIGVVLLIIIARMVTLWRRRRRIKRAVADSDGAETPSIDSDFVDYGDAPPPPPRTGG